MKKRWSVGGWSVVTPMRANGNDIEAWGEPQDVWVEEARFWTKYSADLRVEGWRQAGSYWHQVRDLKEEK